MPTSIGKAAAIFTGTITLEEESKVLADYVVGQRLGEGAYGSVYVAKYMPSGESFALKILQKQDLFQTYADSTSNETVGFFTNASTSSPLGGPGCGHFSGSPQEEGVVAKVMVPPTALLAPHGGSPKPATETAAVPQGDQALGTATNSFAALPSDLTTPVSLPRPIADNPFDRLVVQEAAVMQSLEHPHVVKLYKFLNSTVAFYFIMELAEGGELFDLIISKRYFSEDEARHYFQQLISAIDYCHRNGVAHKDLKAENLLLSRDGRLLVCDFGFSSKAVIRNVDDPEEAGTAVEAGGAAGEPVTVEGMAGNNAAFGTLHYMSPEAVRASAMDCPFGGASDLFWGRKDTQGAADEEDGEYSCSDGGGGIYCRRYDEGSDDDDDDGYCASAGVGSSRPASFVVGAETYQSPYAQLRAAARRAEQSSYYGSPTDPSSPSVSSLAGGVAPAARGWATDHTNTNANSSFVSASGKDGAHSSFIPHGTHCNANSSGLTVQHAGTSPTVTTPDMSTRPSITDLTHYPLAHTYSSTGATRAVGSGRADVAVPTLTQPSQGLGCASPTTVSAPAAHGAATVNLASTSMMSKVGGQLNAWVKSITGEKVNGAERRMRHSTSLGSLSEASVAAGGDRASVYLDDGTESDLNTKKSKKREGKHEKPHLLDRERKKGKETKKQHPTSFASRPSSEDLGEGFGGTTTTTTSGYDVHRPPSSSAALGGPGRAGSAAAAAGCEDSEHHHHHEGNDPKSTASTSRYGKKGKSGKPSSRGEEQKPTEEERVRLRGRESEAANTQRGARRRQRRKKRAAPTVVDPYQQDLWSAGVILFFMLAGRLPFDGRDDEETQHLIERGTFAWTEEEEMRISPEARQLVNAMLVVDPTDRPSLDDIIATKWFVRHLNIADDFPHREEELTKTLVQAGLMLPVRAVGPCAALRLGAGADGHHHHGHGNSNNNSNSGHPSSAEEGVAMSSASSFLDFSTSHPVTESEERALAIAFNKVDRDGYGKITRDELRDMMTTLHGDVVEQQSVSELVWLFTGDPEAKEITFKQFRDAWVNKDLANIPFTHSSEFQLANIIGTQMDDVERTVVRQLREAFNSVDVHHSGVIDIEELRSVFERCHIAVQDEDLRSLMKFFSERDLLQRNNNNSFPGRPGTPAMNAAQLAAVTNSSFASASSKRGLGGAASPAPRMSSPTTTTPSPPQQQHTHCISFDAFVMGIVHREILLRHPLGRKLAAATNLTALFHSRNVTECVRHGFLIAGLQNVVLEKLSSVPERLLLLYSDEVVSTTENIYSFRYLGSSALLSGATMETAQPLLASSSMVVAQSSLPGAHSMATGETASDTRSGHTVTNDHTVPFVEGRHSNARSNSVSVMRCPMLQRHERARRLLSVGMAASGSSSNSNAGALTRYPAPTVGDFLPPLSLAASLPSQSHTWSYTHSPLSSTATHAMTATPATPFAKPPVVPPLSSSSPHRANTSSNVGGKSDKGRAAALPTQAEDPSHAVLGGPSYTMMASSVPVMVPNALSPIHDDSSSYFVSQNHTSERSRSHAGGGDAGHKSKRRAARTPSSSIDSNDGESQYSSGRCSSSVLDSTVSLHETMPNTPQESMQPCPSASGSNGLHKNHSNATAAATPNGQHHPRHRHHHHHSHTDPHAGPRTSDTDTLPSVSPRHLAELEQPPTKSSATAPLQQQQQQQQGIDVAIKTAAESPPNNDTHGMPGPAGQLDTLPTTSTKEEEVVTRNAAHTAAPPSSTQAKQEKSAEASSEPAAQLPDFPPFHPSSPIEVSPHGSSSDGGGGGDVSGAGTTTTPANAMATSLTHRVLAFGGGGAVSQVNGVCDVDIILAPACLGYTVVRFRRIHGKTSDFHEAVTYISNLLEFERQQAVEDTMPCGESELM